MLFALRRGALTEEGLSDKLRGAGKPEAEVEHVVAAVGRLRERAG